MRFIVEQIKGKIVLNGQNVSSLKEKIAILKSYTKKVDPIVPLKEPKIQELKKNKLLENGFTHAIVLDDILPRIVQVLYGDHDLGKSYGNCHGAACAAAGVFPAMANGFLIKNMQEVFFDDLSPGDIITLKNLDHSFVYLDQDLCLSMNGHGEAFKFHALKDILKLYGGFEILNKENSDGIAICRKQPDLFYPEEILSILLKYYKIVKEGSLHYRLSTDRNADELIKIAKKLRQETMTYNPDNQKLPLKELCNKTISTMPLYAVFESEKWAQKEFPLQKNKICEKDEKKKTSFLH